MFFFVMYQNPVNTNVLPSHPSKTQAQPGEILLSLSTNKATIQPGQVSTIDILIQDPANTAELVQVEIAYDPMMMTVENILPGTFFTNPTVVLHKIDPYNGRISYALRCPPSASENKPNCINPTSNIVATVTITANPSLAKKNTTISLLPKTLIRDADGHEIIHKTQELQLTIANTKQ